MNKKLSFVLVTPKNMRGGTIAIHELCRELNRQGCSAKVFYIYDDGSGNLYKFWLRWIICTIHDVLKEINNKRTWNSLGGCRRKIIPFVNKKTIVVYPDIMYGNVLNSDRVVRWMLSYLRYKGVDGAYGNDDLFFCYRLQFNDEALNPMRRKLFVIYYNFDIYKRTNYDLREGKCFIIHKGKNRADLPSEFDGVIIDDLSERDKVRVFNRCEYCICYDLQTAYITIAALCGCIVILIPEEGKTKSDYFKEDDVNFDGVAFGLTNSEIEHARRTQCNVSSNIEMEIENGKNSVRDFVKVCSEYFRKG